MKVLIVDDEPLARARLKRLLAEHAQFKCIGEAATAAEAWKSYQELEPDVILLDIELAGSNGLQLAKQLSEQLLPPAVIFVTAHPQHALAAFQASPVDYLVKPVTAERLSEALKRVGLSTRAHIERKHAEDKMITYHSGTATKQVALSQVRYFEADQKYVRMVFPEGEALLEDSLVQLEQKYPTVLLRIHRRLLINKQHFISLNMCNDGRHLITLADVAKPLEVSRRAYSRLKTALQIT